MKKLIFILSVFIFASCGSDDDNGDNNVYLTITPETINKDFTESNEIINIKSNTTWKITNIPDWCVFDKTEGSNNADIKVSIKENYSSTERKSTINVNDKNISITQKGSVLNEGDAIVINEPNYDTSFDIVRYTISGNIETPFARYKLDENSISTNWNFKRSNIISNSYIIENINPLYEKGCTFGCVPSVTLKFIYKYTDSNYGLSYVKNNFDKPIQLIINNSSYSTDNNFTDNNFEVEKQNTTYIFTFKNYKTKVSNTEYYIFNGKMKFTLK